MTYPPQHRKPCLLAAIAICISFFPSVAGADQVFEPFDYPVQFDSTGFGPSGGKTYRATTTGSYGTAIDTFVFSLSEGFSSGAGIINESGNFVARLTTSSAGGFAAGETGFLSIADWPGSGDTSPAGPFASFFASPQNLIGATGSVDIRVASGNRPAFFRMLVEDSTGRGVATDLRPLSSTWNTYSVVDADFVNNLQVGDPDPTQIVLLGLEFFAQADGSGNIDAMEFRVDNLSLAQVPEPAGGVAVIATVFSVFRRRRQAGRAAG